MEKWTERHQEVASQIMEIYYRELLERDHFLLVEDCLEHSGSLDLVDDIYYLSDGCPLHMAERSQLRDFLEQSRSNELEGQDLVELEAILERVSRPSKIQALLQDLHFHNAMHDSAAAKKIRVQLRKLGHFVSREKGA